MLKTSLSALAALAAMVAVSPASAATYSYTMTNNDVLTISTDTQSATFKGATINASMTSADFASFAGGAAPTFTGRIGAHEGAGSAGDVLAAAHLYNPSLLLAGIGSPFAFKTRDGAFDLNLAWKDLRVSHRIRKGALDEAQLADWMRQAAALPGEKM